MCDPVTAAGLALSMGGTYLQQREADRNAKAVANARNEAFAAHTIGQQKFADEAGAAFNHNITKQGKENFDEQRNAETARIEQAFNERRVQPDYNTGLTANAPKNVVLARKAASDEAAAETNRDVGNNAALQSYGGALFNQGLDRSEFARLFGNVQDKAGADTRMLPLKIQAAGNNAQKAPSIFPTLMKAAGTGLSLFGSAGGSFTNQVPGAPLPNGVYGPPAPITEYGLFMDSKPVNLFGYNLAGRL